MVPMKGRPVPSQLHEAHKLARQRLGKVLPKALLTVRQDIRRAAGDDFEIHCGLRTKLFVQGNKLPEIDVPVAECDPLCCGAAGMVENRGITHVRGQHVGSENLHRDQGVFHDPKRIAGIQA